MFAEKYLFNRPLKIIRFYGALLLLCFIFPVIVQAETTSVFGPKQFTINFTHFHFSQSTIPVTNPGTGEIHISKTFPDKKIRNGYIFYNSQLLSLDKFFRGDTLSFSKDIEVVKRSRLIVFLFGSPGAAINVSINLKSSVTLPEVQFTATPQTISAGESSILTWTVSQADSVAIAPEIGRVEATGSLTVTPTQSTEYHLTASGPGGTATATTTVSVTKLNPNVSLTASPTMIAPGKSSTLSWNSEYAKSCRLEPDVGDIPLNGQLDVTPLADTLYTITASGHGGSSKAQVLVEVFPVKIKDISVSEATYLSPENTAAATSSALRNKDLEWYYKSFSAETAAQDKAIFESAGIDPSEKFSLVQNNTDFIINKLSYKDGMILALEKRFEDIDGSIVKGWAGFIQEDGLWKVTYKYSQDEELQQYNDVHYAYCIAGYSFDPAESTEDSCWHDNNLTNLNETKVALDKRYDTDLSTAELNGENNGLFLNNLKDMPATQISMGGWVKADNTDHVASIIEIGHDENDSTAIVLPPGEGITYWIHANSSRVQRTSSTDYDFHDNQWHHIYLTYDGAAVRLYIDAQLKDSSPISGALDLAPILNIGQRNSAVYGGTADSFKGRLDDIQIYNKALSAEEVTAKFNNGTIQSL